MQSVPMNVTQIVDRLDGQNTFCHVEPGDIF